MQEIENIVGKTEPEEILDYIYAVLHSPAYREKYKEFLKIDFPRVPYPKDKKTFKALVALGTELRSLHLLESPKVNQFITTFPIDGNGRSRKNKIRKRKSLDKQIHSILAMFRKQPGTFILAVTSQHKSGLKTAKGQKLTNQDIEHYQKIIVALSETDRIMKEIDKVCV